MMTTTFSAYFGITQVHNVENVLMVCVTTIVTIKNSMFQYSINLKKVIYKKNTREVILHKPE